MEGSSLPLVESACLAPAHHVAILLGFVMRVLSGELMPVRAVGSFQPSPHVRDDNSFRCSASIDVHLLSHGLEVHRVYAVSDPAKVVDYEPVGDRADIELVTQSMGVLLVHLAVPVRQGTGRPDPVPAWGDDELALEALDGWCLLHA